MKSLQLLAALLSFITPPQIATAEPFATTRPSRIGDMHYVRASYSVKGKQNDRTVIMGRVKVLTVDSAGVETSAALEIEKSARIVDGVEHQLIPPGETMLLKRVDGKRIDLLRRNGDALPPEITRYARLVTGLRGESDDLDFWNGGQAVDEARLRKIIATADFSMDSVRSESRAAPGEFVGRLSIPKLVGRGADAPLKYGTFAAECRWRAQDGQLERYRRTRWVLHEKRGAAGELTTRIVEIVGIESIAVQPWWAKSTEEVARDAADFAATNDPLLGFYCERDAAAVRTAAENSPAAFDKDEITSLLRMK
jgi:hypothetical protein